MARRRPEAGGGGVGGCCVSTLAASAVGLPRLQPFSHLIPSSPRVLRTHPPPGPGQQPAQPLRSALRRMTCTGSLTGS